MNFLRYTVSRLFWSIFVVLGVVFVVFLVSNVVPSDPAALWVGPKATHSAIQAAREKLKLDRPILLRFGYF